MPRVDQYADAQHVEFIFHYSATELFEPPNMHTFIIGTGSAMLGRNRATLRRLGFRVLPDPLWDICKEECARIAKQKSHVSAFQKLTLSCNSQVRESLHALHDSPNEEAHTFMRVVYVAAQAASNGYRVDPCLLELNSIVLGEERQDLKGITFMDLRSMNSEHFGPDETARAQVPDGVIPAARVMGSQNVAAHRV